MTTCPRCGMQLPSGTAACTGCGFVIGAGAPPPTAASPPMPYSAPPPTPPTWQQPPPPSAYPPAPPGWQTPPPGYPPAPGYYPGYPPSQGTNGFAIASLVLGILWIYGLGSLLAVIFGHVAKRQIRERHQGGAGLSTAGLVLGYVGIAGAAVLIAIFVGLFAASAHVITDVQHSQLRSDLFNAATAEENVLTQTNQYTNSTDELQRAGFYGGFDETLYAGYDGARGYCILGAVSGSQDWYLYDSEIGGVQASTYGTAAEAEQLCEGQGIGNFAQVG